MVRLTLGIDVGTVSAKWALAGEKGQLKDFTDSRKRDGEVLSEASGDGSSAFVLSEYHRVQGRPLSVVSGFIRDISGDLDFSALKGIIITGSSAAFVGRALGIPVENEFKAVSRGMAALYPDVENIFEMGGENSKFIRISRAGGETGIVDYETNGDCAAGTGSFMDQQASRLQFDIRDVGELVIKAERSPKIAGRCSVFAKSDMIHAQQKGYGPAEVLRGLCDAVARNFRSNIAKGKDVSGRTAFIGGVALNRGIASAVREVFSLDEKDFFIPSECVHLGAIGAAIAAAARSTADPLSVLDRAAVDTKDGDLSFPSLPELSTGRVRFLREKTADYSFEGAPRPIDAYLGVDVGSVSTNLALIDRAGSVIKEIYLRTRARPIEVVNEGLQEIKRELGDRVAVRGVGTTGSGRELIGQLIGADTINDEITAHKTGASFIGDKLLSRKPDTIFEIGGQDSKFISIQDGVVIDFTMNEACAAGTGSFLEEQAEKLDIEIKDQFASMAFDSSSPLRMGERCTVYMEQDVSSYMKRGANKNDIVAGLAYSVVQNYLNRVVRGRKIGDSIFFQGGTAYNDSVAAAFSEVLDKEIIVPPHNGVMGAIGSALLAREKVLALGRDTTFRGFDITEIDYSIREFTCKGCTNYCNIQEFTVEGERTYWGDKCSDRYRKNVKVAKKPVIPNLLNLYEKLLERDALEAVCEMRGEKISRKWDGRGDPPRVGLPRAMYHFDRYPFWKTYLQAMGMETVTSIESNREIVHLGLENIVAEPCFPIQIAHGHAVSLLEEGVDLILIPNVLNVETDSPEVNSYLCPWGQTLPYVIGNTPVFRDRPGIISSPSVHFREGEGFVEKQLWTFARRFGVKRKRHRKAVWAAYRAMELFGRDIMMAGNKALETLEQRKEAGIVLVGRPYNIMDKEVNMGVPSKLRDYYGINVIPYFFLPLGNIDISGIGGNMFWNYGRRILQAVKFVDRAENLNLIYMTNFKCGPDSYVKSFAAQGASRPFLTLQFDSHGNDAGIMTRCEAYLDSKGVLRWWKGRKGPLETEKSTSQECHTKEREPSRRHSEISA